MSCSYDGLDHREAKEGGKEKSTVSNVIGFNLEAIEIKMKLPKFNQRSKHESADKNDIISLLRVHLISWFYGWPLVNVVLQEPRVSRLLWWPNQR